MRRRERTSCKLSWRPPKVSAVLLFVLQIFLCANFSTTSGEETTAAREGWVHSDEVYRRLEEIRQQHQEGLDSVRQVHNEEIAKINADRQDAIRAFAALTRSSADLEKSLREEIASANTRTEQLQLAVKDATSRIIGKFTSFECLFLFIPSLF